MDSKINNILEQTFLVFEKYYVRLKKENKFIFAYIEFATREDFLMYDKDEYSSIVIEEVTQKKKYTLLECQKYGTEVSDKVIKIKYRVDKISDDILIDLNKKFIKEVELTFTDINWFVNDEKLYKFDPIKVSINVNGFNMEYLTNIGKIIVYRSFLFFEKSDEFNINSGIVFKFIFNKKVDYYEFRKRIYCFRNLLLILGRRYIDIKNVKINNNDLYDCHEEYNYKPLNKRYMEYLDYHTITIGSIDKFGEAVSKFFDIYDTIISIIDSYFCNLKYVLPTKVKFINVCAMIEDYANIFLVDESRKYREKEATKNKHKFITKSVNKMLEQNIIDKSNSNLVVSILDEEVKKDLNLTFKDKVISIIKNVNESFKFNDDDIELIADNFREARKQFVHKGLVVRTEVYPILEKYCSFVEDIIYLNILKEIGIDISNSIFECIEYNYEKDDLIIVFK